MIRRAVLMLLVCAIGIGFAANAGQGTGAQAANPDAEIHLMAISNSICLAFGGSLPAPCFDTWNPGSQARLADIITKGAPEAPPRGTSAPAPLVGPDTRICPAKVQPPATAEKVEANDPALDHCRLLPSDFQGLELDGNQLHQDDPANISSGFGPFSGLYIFAFVPDDGPIEFQTTKGKFNPTQPGPTLTGAPTQRFVCDGQFDDCDGNNVSLKGLVVVPLGGYGADLGPGRVTVSQGTKSAALDFTVVGEPNTISIQAFKTTISNGIKDIGDKDGTPGSARDSALSGPDECPLPTSLEGFTKALARPDKTVLIGRILDAAGTQITQGWVSWTGTGVTKAEPIGEIAQYGAPITPTVDLGSFGFGAPQVLCGTKGAGIVTIKASINMSATDIGSAGLIVDPKAHQADAFSMDITVINPAANATAISEPPVIDCNGTNSAKVSATILNIDGQPVPNGQKVQFSVQALGTANPIVASTANGVASTTVTPLSPVDELRGTTVVITTIPSNTSYDPVSTAVRVDCSGAAVPAAGGAAAGAGTGAGAGAGASSAPTGSIRGPDTGSGGPAKGAAPLAWWPLVLLATGAFALAGVRFATKRD